MRAPKTDILIAGAGPAGLIAAASLARTGLQITLIDRRAPITDGTDHSADWRSTAFLRPAIALFEQSGLWPALSPHGRKLKALRIVDLAGEPPALRADRLFEAADMGPGPFGWNFLNWQIRASLMAHLEALPNVTLRFGAGVAGLVTRLDMALVQLEDGAQLAARLAVAADGRDSALRRAAGIGVATTRYGQKSLAFAATHDRPHDDISTEIYHQGGPFTMVPLPDIGGRPASAIVWMNPGPRAVALQKMDDAALRDEMHRRTAGLFGTITPVSPRGLFPIITRRAHAMTGQRLALIAEAAHVLPPIGAQGLNTSVNDIAALLAAIEAGPGDPGAAPVLTAYARARQADVHLRAAAIDLFNRVTRSGLPPLQQLRLAGLKAAHDIAPLRRGLMRAGLGPPGAPIQAGAPKT